ncbi:MAG: hypothetical protein SYR96_25705 [Actinomycetota bacterium]|nr:hypothetical protein [Actinomycetota bacterium]
MPTRSALCQSARWQSLGQPGHITGNAGSRWVHCTPATSTSPFWPYVESCHCNTPLDTDSKTN